MFFAILKLPQILFHGNVVLCGASDFLLLYVESCKWLAYYPYISWDSIHKKAGWEDKGWGGKCWRKKEIVLSNDDSSVPLPDDIWSNRVEIKILETKENRGIQVARIAGLKAAAIYCRCYNGKRQTYNYDRFSETAFERRNILSVR